MATKIVTKNSSTASAAPTASDLVQGELAVNVTDKRLFTENASGAIVELGTAPSTIDINAGTIDGTTIGAASASTGAFTTLAASGVLTANAGVKVDNFTLDGTTLALSSGDMNIDAVAAINFNSDSGNFRFQDGAVDTAIFQSTGSNFIIRGLVSDRDLAFHVNDGGVERTALTLDGSAAGAATFNAGVTSTELTATGGSGVAGTFSTSNSAVASFTRAGTSTFNMTIGDLAAGGSQLWLDAQTADTGYAFRTKNSGGTAVNAVFIEPAGNVGIGTISPGSYYAETLVVAAADEGGVTIECAPTEKAYLMFADGTSGDAAYRGYFGFDHALDSLNVSSSGYVNFYTGDTGSNAERMRIDSSGNVLVGGTTANGASTVTLGPSGYVYARRASDVSGVFDRSTTDGSIVELRKDGATVGSIGTSAGSLYIGGDSTGGIYFNGTTDIRPWNKTTQANLDNSIDLGTSSSRFKDAYLSGGIYLGGTGAANKLDDYEEGTFTATLGGAGGNPTVAYNTQIGRYTKVGNTVHIAVKIITNSSSGGSGMLTVEGLPFAVAASTTDFSATIGFNYNFVTGEAPHYALFQTGSTHIILYKDAATNTNCEVSDVLASGNTYLVIGGTYTV